MFEIKARPDFIRSAAAPLDPIFEGEIGRVFDALRFLQRRANNATAAAGNGCGAATFRCGLQNNGFGTGLIGLYRRRYSRAAAANDDHVGLQS